MYPALHRQAASEVEAAGDWEFSLQEVHAAEPGDTLKVLASHALHAPPSAPVYPALQIQSVLASLPAGLWELSVHC